MNDERCFLEQGIWQNVLRSAISETDTLSNSSGIAVNLWIIVCPIPSLFKDVQNAICDPTNTDMHTTRILFARVLAIRTSLNQWRREYEEYISSHDSSEQSGVDKQYDLLGIYMANIIIINRLNISLHPLSGTESENETQDLARQLIQLELKASSANPRASLFMAFKVVAAQAALDTHEEWQQAIKTSVEDPTDVHALVDRQIFERWVRLKGRKIRVGSAATVEGG